jgi:uncharacterized protein YjiK
MTKIKPKRIIVPKLIASLLLLSTLLFCAKENHYEQHKIASIDEASGISYCHDSNTLIVANDEGNFYEIDPKGEILSRHKLGEFDFEGVVCEPQKLTFAIEGGALLEVNRASLQSNYLKLKGKGIKINKKSGIEGIAKIGSLYYLSIQSKKKEDAKIVVVKKGKNYAKVIQFIDLGIIDAAGLAFYQDKLYIVSDKKEMLYSYRLQKDEIKQRVKLPHFAQEGITFDHEGNVYFADDNGAVLKYTTKELGIK